MTTTVVNLRDFPLRIALDPDGIWRRGRHLPLDVMRIDRPSRWGNPYRIGPDGTREEVIEKYRRWFLGPTLHHPPTADFLEPLRGKRLACWCAPLPCHGDVIVEMLG